MLSRSLFLTLFFVAASTVSGCASLSAEHPLFAAADQIGPAPLTEGIWLGVGNDDCPERNAHRQRNFDRRCAPLEIRRVEDGSWQARFRADLAPRLSADDRSETERFGTVHFVLVPATEYPSPNAYSPIYVAELRSTKQNNDTTSYFAIVPLAELPARAMLLLDMSCPSVLRDGPVDGIAVTYESPSPSAPASAEPSIASCVASTQGAVREAARRTLIQSVGRNYDQRFVLIRPLDR